LLDSIGDCETEGVMTNSELRSDIHSIEPVFDRILELNRRTGLGVLLVEQNSAMALEIASRAFVLETGVITLSGPSAVLADDPRIREAYLGG
jgi:branched-chain amino acid transport system ATP-binding protein